MSTPVCHVCKRVLRDGENVWADDWKVIGVGGQRATFRAETRYTCDDCADCAS